MNPILLFTMLTVLTVSIGISQTKYEAEDATLTGVRISNAVPGFSGTGYVVYEAEGSIAIQVEKATVGSCGLVFGYRSQYDEKKQDLYINGTKIGEVTFPKSDVFRTLDYGDVTLNAGTNIIELRKFYGYMDLDYFQIGDTTNPAPIAKAGWQQVKMDVDGDGKEIFTLDASASMDPDNDIIRYSWYYDETLVAESSDPVTTYEATLGGHELTLKVEDANGNSDTDTIKLFVGDPTNGGNNRIGVINNSQFIFSSGINLAWDKYASDIVNLDVDYFEGVLNALQMSGGNTMRWWLHTNGANSPIFDASGNVIGLNPVTIPNMRTVLDMAYSRGIVISMCLWSFDMLRPQGQDMNIMKNLLENREKTQTYIDNALIPIVEELGDHPALLTWEVFNEPENMSQEFGFTDQRTPMVSIQQFINLTAGAIHRTVPEALVSSGAGSFETLTDIEGRTNYYRDDRLIAAGGDALGTLDFYQVHYYPSNFDVSLSPFHRPADWWQLDKPIVLGEFPSRAIDENDAPSYTTTEAYQLAYNYGYAGAMAWDYIGFDGGSFETSKAGIMYLAENYPEDININIDPTLINNPPIVIATVPDLNVMLGAYERIEGYVVVDTLFYDTEDLLDLDFSIASNTNEALLTAEITNDYKLNLQIIPGQVGRSILTLRARDSKGASTVTSFAVNVRDANGNLALFKPVVSSTIEKEEHIASFANDGDLDSRWSSVYEDNQWIYVDLEASVAISSIKLLWEAASAKSYDIQVSADGTNWDTVFAENNGNGGEDIIPLNDVVGRYVRMLGKLRNTPYGFSLFEFEVYGTALSIADLANHGVKLYPNPILNDNLNIQVKDADSISVELIDLLGRTIERFELQGNTTYKIDTQNVQTGIILVKIIGQNWTVTQKMIKK